MNGAALICQFGARMYSSGLVRSADGNLSVRLPSGVVLITPSGAAKGFLKEKDIAKISPAGELIDGRPPSTELKMHLAVYAARPDVSAVVHAHPSAACAFAINGLPLSGKYMPESAEILGDIPVLPYSAPGGEELARSVGEAARFSKGALLANHGSVVWASTLQKAFDMTELLEFYCGVMIKARVLGNPRPFA